MQLLHKRTEEEKLFSRSFRAKNQEKQKTARGLATCETGGIEALPTVIFTGYDNGGENSSQDDFTE